MTEVPAPCWATSDACGRGIHGSNTNGDAAVRKDSDPPSRSGLNWNARADRGAQPGVNPPNGPRPTRISRGRWKGSDTSNPFHSSYTRAFSFNCLSTPYIRLVNASPTLHQPTQCTMNAPLKKRRAPAGFVDQQSQSRGGTIP